MQNSDEKTSILTYHQVCLGKELEGESGYFKAQPRILLEWLCRTTKNRNECILINVQRDATIWSLSFILLQYHSTCFGCRPHPSSRVHKTVVIATGTSHKFVQLLHSDVDNWPRRSEVLFYCSITLRVSGVVHTHHQEYINL